MPLLLNFSARLKALVTCVCLICTPAIAQAPGDGNDLDFRGRIDARSAANAGGGMDGGMQNITGGVRRPAIVDNTPGRRGIRANPAPNNSANGQTVVDESGIETLIAPDDKLPTLTNPFQQFIEQTYGNPLPLFGYELFQNVPTTFAPVQNIPVTQDYVVGPGDELVIRAWGQIDVDLRTVVDREGNVNIPRVGPVNVAGMKFPALQPHLKGAISRVFQNFEMTVSMGQLRSIQVYVVGQARRPGTYTLSSLSTLVNAVFSAGGPSGKGSMRKVQLKRGGQVLAELDMYDLLLHGDKSGDVALAPGDVIYFPNVGPQAAVTGTVNSPAIYELKAGQTRMKDVLTWAGGLTAVAANQAATVERIDANKQRRVDEVSLDTAGLSRVVRDGDLITLRSISPRFENAVTLKGFVARPGRYAVTPGMRVRDLLPNKEALVSADFWRKRNTQGLEVQPTPQLRGATLSSNVLSTEEINWDYAVIERLKADQSVTLVPFNLGLAILDGDPKHDLLLQPGDIVTVFSKDEIRVPREKRKRYITLEGEFATPGIYEVLPGESLRELVSRAGGFGRDAYTFGASFTRESVRVEQQRRMNEAAERLEKDFERAAMTRKQAAVTKEQSDTTGADLMAQRMFIDKLKQAKAQGRVVLEIPRDTVAVRDIPDLELEDGDRFYLPPRPSTVSVLGAVFNENSFVYRREKRLGDYLAQAGGATRDADSGSIYLLRADGSVMSKRQDSWLLGSLEGERIMPGDAIIVPETLERFNFTREAKAWTEIFYQFALGVAGLRVLKNGVN